MVRYHLYRLIGRGHGGNTGYGYIAESVGLYQTLQDAKDAINDALAYMLVDWRHCRMKFVGNRISYWRPYHASDWCSGKANGLRFADSSDRPYLDNKDLELL